MKKSVYIIASDLLKKHGALVFENLTSLQIHALCRSVLKQRERRQAVRNSVINIRGPLLAKLRSKNRALVQLAEENQALQARVRELESSAAVWLNEQRIVPRRGRSSAGDST